jgi:hypothetical protein
VTLQGHLGENLHRCLASRVIDDAEADHAPDRLQDLGIEEGGYLNTVLIVDEALLDRSSSSASEEPLDDGRGVHDDQRLSRARPLVCWGHLP